MEKPQEILVSNGNMRQASDWLERQGYERPDFSRRRDHLPCSQYTIYLRTR